MTTHRTRPAPTGRATRAAALNGAGSAAPEWIELLPAGPKIVGRDGRSWRLTDAARVIADSAKNRPLHVDYEHASELRGSKGEEAPAAGWISELEARDGAIWGRVEWTRRAAEMVTAREYRYLSPVFLYDTSTREVLSLVSAGLTNRPNLDMRALNRHVHLHAERDGGDDDPQPEQRPTMDKAKRAALCRELSLQDEAGDDAILAAVATLKSEKATALNAAQTPSLEKFVPRADYDKVTAERDTALNTLLTEKKTKAEAEITAAVDAAVAAGKIAPASKDYHLASCRAEGGLDRFKAFVASAPVLTAPSKLGSEQPGAATGSELTADEKALCTRMGVSEKDFKAAKAA